MSNLVRVELEPLGRSLEVEAGSPLQDLLFSHGVEFPCGGRGKCKRCRVRVLAGTLVPTEEEQQILGAADIAAGWRLACRARVDSPVKLDVAQWETTILTDESVFEFTPSAGLGVAVDLGTTTLVAQLLDLETGHVLAVRTALNPQAAYGGDVMSRVELAVAGGGAAKLESLIRDEIGRMIAGLAEDYALDGRRVHDVAIVGNTVMHHLFCGLSLHALAQAPFETTGDGLVVFRASELGWTLPAEAAVRFLPCLGSFVGSDILAGIVATKMHLSQELVALIDLGTNGEIVVGNRDRMICASTAAGPAFEGGRIGMGMRASTGAISSVILRDGGLLCKVMGGGEPRGLCGSGLVDAVAVGLELGRILPAGRLAQGKLWDLCPPVRLAQSDIRELQLAKGAIAAGARILLARLGAAMADVTRVYLAGAFGNYVSRSSARRIGLLDFPLDKIEPAGNTALLGAKMALFSPRSGEELHTHVRRVTEHLSLAADPSFQDTYVDEMLFPAV
jgi:uncharacterized 2Fe-2S/4Fe-4S cluster protein (DUF4445 family)